MIGPAPVRSSGRRLSPAELHAAMAAPADADGFASRWQPVGDLRLHIRQRVSPSPEPIACVLLHGLAVSHRYLMPTARRLRKRRVYVPDLPGFGRSGRPAAVLDVAGHARVVAAWLDDAGLGPIAVLGNSFGAQVAVQVAASRPDLVAALVLVGPTTDPAAASMSGQLGRLLRDLPHEDPQQARILAADLRDAGLRRVVATLRHAVRDPIAPKLAALRVPTLLARGSRDRIAPQPWLDHLAALVPGARMLVLAGAAHNAVTTAGAELAEAVDEFLANALVPPVTP